MPGDTGMKPGDVHWVVGVKDAYRAATGREGFNSTEARKWLNANGFSVFRLKHPVDEIAVEREDP
ncbi:hypothetical protein [Rhodovulum adriaticum]|uniref:Uncharacterized protein n=1 Tax=Rhodovulum adriaticum TaxID=35804 RepID=A0A4R2NNB3_RHOAD|nr:hypothetical protein [Rhodovulum adriaticum]MBK1636936.1 hypothetical protein [Rhodovulum adriaticum]TCP22788.1 hypothetical protein EV656_10587 [Rhodovulum adriaticum]